MSFLARYKFVLLSGMLAVTLIVCSKWILTLQRKLAMHEVYAEQHHVFCEQTLIAIREDKHDFESDVDGKAEAALIRYSESTVMYHNSASIMMCAAWQYLPEFPTLCWLNKSMKCMAEHAGKVIQVLDMHLPPTG
jgi:hypothetical protein